MDRKFDVLLAGCSTAALEELQSALSGRGNLACRTWLLTGAGQGDVRLAMAPTPDALVVQLEPGGARHLAALADGDAESRPPLIVIGPSGDAEAVRLAVRSGARDFLPAPAPQSELVAVLERVLHEAGNDRAAPQKSLLTTVIGAAGGVGTSFIACNMAHALASAQGVPTLLLDLDVNDAPLAGFLDLSPQRGLLEALAELQHLDEHALAGYVTKHRSGLHLMGAPSASSVRLERLDAQQFAQLLEIVTRRYGHVVVDALRGNDPFGRAALAAARNVVVVVQQSVAQLRQATRLLRLLGAELGLPDDRIHVVVNRYRKHSTVALDDVRRALGREHVATVPNHYDTVLASIDGGVPLHELERSSAVAKAIVGLLSEVTGAPPAVHRSLLRRAWPILTGG